MAQRIAAALALIVFAVCLIVGLEADNTFGTTVMRAITAMVVTFFIGLALGMMAQKMLDENLKTERDKLMGGGINEGKTQPSDR
jgi:NhaP-type Na+/H+ or K+/H+ antiporter